MATYEQHLNGVLAAFNAAEKVAYSVDSLPDVLPPYYIEISVHRRGGGTERASGETGWRLGRVIARAVALTQTNAYRMFDLIDALENQTVTIGGVVSTPIRFENDDEVIGPEAGKYVGTKSLAYALV
jgi:hypothetical protein